jgi:hypothetical protein
MLTQTIGWLLGLKNVSSIDQIGLAYGAGWAQEQPFWVFFGVAVLVALSFYFYLKFQPRGSKTARICLAISRGLLLSLLFITLADPTIRIISTRLVKKDLFVIVDGTDSMAIEDKLTQKEREQLASATGLTLTGDQNASRMALVQSLLTRKDKNLLKELEKKNVNLELFVFDGPTTSQLRKLNKSGDDPAPVDLDNLAEQLTTKGQVTALGNAILDARQQSHNLAGVILFSDFVQNSGPLPLGDGRRQSPAARLDAPIYTVGIGATEAIDLAADIQVQPKIRQAENTTILVKLQNTGLQGRQVNVKVTARSTTGDAAGEVLPVGEKTVTLNSTSDIVEFPYQPKEHGKFRFSVEAEPVEGEIDTANNKSERDANIIKDFVRLMYVAYEPTWEWRFVKEVFYRDKTVGMQGFRTFLASSDPRVRESNELFLPTITPKREEFYRNDVIFLDDMPASALSPRFCEMVQRFVNELGGGLVVIAGPRFGPRELYNTPLAEMLPVKIDPQLTLKSDREFKPRLTPVASMYPFMRLGENDFETTKAWDNLRGLECYQPVAAVHERAEVLAEHPTDVCADGKTHQPLIAIRRYGQGEVVYLAFNETWRLRRAYGEKYYRNFWSPLIDRLGLSHAMGDQKRFVPKLDRTQYRVDDVVTFTVQAYDENYDPLTDDKLQDKKLVAELTAPTRSGEALPREVQVNMLREGVFEARIPVYTAGGYSIRIKDPVTQETIELPFDVTGVSVERRNATRDLRTQHELATETKGKTYELTNVSALPDDIKVAPKIDHSVDIHPLWSTPLWFIAAIVLMIGEWLSRKLMNMT